MLKKALRDAGLPYIHCLGHTLDLILKDTLDDSKGASDLIEKVSNIVKIPHSIILMEKLAASQVTVGLCDNTNKFKKLILNVATQWNSTYSMLERFFELKDALAFIQ